jgi:hypothetical protein
MSANAQRAATSRSKKLIAYICSPCGDIIVCHTFGSAQVWCKHGHRCHPRP